MSCSYYTFRQNDYYCTKKKDYVNSDIYYKYCRNYDYEKCPEYKLEQSEGCFITTACVYAKGLPDDCEELRLFRKFRDEWLAHQEEGEKLISQYYSIAPDIVEQINHRKDAWKIYDNLYAYFIIPCLELIIHEKYKEALDIYQETVYKLMELLETNP